MHTTTMGFGAIQLVTFTPEASGGDTSCVERTRTCWCEVDDSVKEVNNLVPRKKSSRVVATGSEVATTLARRKTLVISGSEVVTYSTVMLTFYPSESQQTDMSDSNTRRSLYRPCIGMQMRRSAARLRQQFGLSQDPVM